MGRTRSHRLRGYGNSISRPQAIAFVEAVIDAFVDARAATERVDAFVDARAATERVE